MEFQKYSSLASASKQKVINAAVDAGHSNLMYGVTEKIHGANFGIHWDAETDEIKFSRRTGFLEEGETFYAHTKIQEALLVRMRILIELALKGVPPKLLSVYGEIYGGMMNGVVEQGTKRVQKEVQYSPKTQFSAFDVVIDGEYAPQSVAFSILSASGFHTAPLLALYETLEEALKHPNDGQSVIPALLGYEVEGDNVIEGVVIRPWNQDIKLGNGSHFILKNKNAEFSEQDFGEVKTTKTPLSAADQLLFPYVAEYINTNRFNAVISKEKALTQKDFGRIMGLLTQDAIAEFNVDHGEEDFDLKDAIDDWKKFSKALQNESGKVVREYWVQEF